MSEGGKTWKILGITCGVIVLLGLCTVGGCFLFCGGAIGGVMQATQAPANAAKGFFADIRAGNYAQAHQRLSPARQQAMPLDVFQAAVQANPSLVSQTDDTINQRNMTMGAATMGGFLSTPSGNVDVDVVLSQQGEYWYIETVSVANAPLLTGM